MKYAAALNNAGQTQVANELQRLGLNWGVIATCAEIEQSAKFGEMSEGDGMEYEISNFAAGIKSYGALGFIEIEPNHIRFEEMDD